MEQATLAAAQDVLRLAADTRRAWLRAVAARQVLAAREPWRSPGDLKLLRRYERARQGDWLRMSLATDGLQQLFGRPEPVAALLRNWGMAAFDASGPLKRRIARLAMGTA